jgi:hypothetical protein
MINSSKIDAMFTQTGGSCVLASYAIAYNYFTGGPATDCFKAYCRHFGIPFSTWQEAEQKYAAHFDNEWKTRGCKGYEIMKELHDHSDEPEFCAARKLFDSIFYNDSAPQLDDLETCLRKNEAILNITFEAGADYHSVSVFADSAGFLKKDTMKQGLTRSKGLSELGILRDGLLHIKKPT